jgi:cell division protein FtsN
LKDLQPFRAHYEERVSSETRKTKRWQRALQLAEECEQRGGKLELVDEEKEEQEQEEEEEEEEETDTSKDFDNVEEGKNDLTKSTQFIYSKSKMRMFVFVRGMRAEKFKISS